ncbi:MULTISPECIES: DUF6966 domain-containing protein [unclassified Aeromicrobium]|uniref:DUF6966 domain-containing protein n=1 Tax=unclassified Aeromicrobium TaxID=2633570 RepID=UPI00396B2C85
MDQTEADLRFGRLLANLSATVRLLSDEGQDHWSSWMAEARAEIAAHDSHGLTRLLSAYGGAGSFNDVWLRPRLPDQRLEQVDAHFSQLRSALYDDASSLLRDLERRD